MDYVFYEFIWVNYVVYIGAVFTSLFGQYIIVEECKKSFRLIIPAVGLICILLKFIYDLLKMQLESPFYYILLLIVVLLNCIFPFVYECYKKSSLGRDS